MEENEHHDDPNAQPTDERSLFEKNIDDNPLEASNHLVYADWLDDHGEHDEAAFRRSLGKWFQDEVPTTVPNERTENSNLFKWRIDRQYLPNGVRLEEVENHYPNADAPGYDSGTKRFLFSSYREMENHFRRSFHTNRKANPEQFSRRRRAIK